MKIYLAAPWKHRFTAQETAAQLRRHGFDVCSRWHDEWGAVPGDEDSKDPEIMKTEAEYDFFDVIGSDAMVVLNIEKSEGKAVEQGLAHALNLPIIVVGHERFNVFQYRDNVKMVPNLTEAMLALNALPR